MSGSSAVSFTPEILHSYSRLENFLVGEATTERAISQVVEAGRYPNWSGRWEVTPWRALPYVLLVSGAKIASCVLSAIGAKRASLWLDMRLKVSGPYFSGDYYTRKYGEDFLAPSLNQYSPDAVDIYMQPAMSKDEIEDEQVREIICPDRIRFELDKDGGMCRGESLWFLRLYFKTKGLFQNSRQHLQAIGQQFSWGAPAEAALIQKLCVKEELLRLRIISAGAIEDTDEPRALRHQAAEIFQKLQPGAYYLVLRKHGMAYVCTGEGQGYLFDPNIGTIAIHDEAGFQKLARIIMSYREDDEGARVEWPYLAIIAGMETVD